MDETATMRQDGANEHGTYTFRGRTFAEVAQKVTKALGRNAYIIEKRQIPADGKSGLLGGLLGGGDELVEVIASSGTPPPPQPTPAKPETHVLRRTYGPAAALAETAPSAAPRPAEAPALGVSGQLEAMERHLQQSLTEQFRTFMSLQACGGLPPVSPPLQDAYRRLVDADVDPQVARDLVESLHHRANGGEVADPNGLERLLVAEMGGRLAVCPPVQMRGEGPTVVAVVGPTGVGKTTTIAKLAVEFVYRRNRTVGILNEDVRRPGAEAQLRNLNQLLGVSVSAAETPERAAEELRHMRELDLVLVDTVGRVPRSETSMASLRPFLEAVRPAEVHAVVSCDASARSANLAVRAFREAGADRLIVSKIDEAPASGLVLGLADDAGLPLSYVTTDQAYTVPVTPADRVAVARQILGLEQAEPEPLAPRWLDEEVDR